MGMDAIVYDLKRNVWYEKRYQEAVKSRILLNIVRAMVLKKRYMMSYSPKLRNIIKKEIRTEDNLVDMLIEKISQGNIIPGSDRTGNNTFMK